MLVKDTAREDERMDVRTAPNSTRAGLDLHGRTSPIDKDTPAWRPSSTSGTSRTPARREARRAGRRRRKRRRETAKKARRCRRSRARPRRPRARRRGGEKFGWTSPRRTRRSKGGGETTAKATPLVTRENENAAPKRIRGRKRVASRPERTRRTWPHHADADGGDAAGAGVVGHDACPWRSTVSSEKSRTRSW